MKPNCQEEYRYISIPTITVIVHLVFLRQHSIEALFIKSDDLLFTEYISDDLLLITEYIGIN